MTLTRRIILALALMAGFAPAMAQIPPPVPALPDTERRTSYSITGSTCACAVGFALYGDSTDYGNWLEVFVNEVLIPSANYTITSPTGSLATIARPITDAVLTFSVAQTGTVQIVGARRPRRTTQFNEGGGVPTRNFNVVLSDLTAQNRETWDKINDVTGRGVFAPPGETIALLPTKANRANQGVCFDANGNLINCVSVPGSTFSAGSNIVFTGTNPTTISTPGFSATINTGNGLSTTGTCSGTTSINCTINSVALDPKSGRFVPLIAGAVSGVSCNATSPFNCLQFGQFKGNQILVNGSLVTIPIGGIVGATGGVMAAVTRACIENSPPTAPVCNQTLASRTTYFVYVEVISGTLTMVFSTSAYNAYTSPFGNTVMNGDNSASLIGLIHTDDSSPTISGTGNQQNSASFFNPVWDGLAVGMSGTFSSASYTGFGPCNGTYTGCLTWVQFSDNVPTITSNCVLNQNSGSPITVTVGIGIGTNGLAATIPASTSGITVDTGNLLRQVAANASGAIGFEGFVISNFLGVSNGSATVTASSCQLTVPSRIPS